jgi:hypothetical protein
MFPSPPPKHFKLVNTAQETCSVLTVWQGDKTLQAVTPQGRFTTFVRNKIIRHARSTLEAEVMSLFGFKVAEGNSSVRQLQYVLRKVSLAMAFCTFYSVTLVMLSLLLSYFFLFFSHPASFFHRMSFPPRDKSFSSSGLFKM